MASFGTTPHNMCARTGLMICPFNEKHTMKAAKYGIHLNGKCPDKDAAILSKNLVQCAYSKAHWIPQQSLEFHMNHMCKSRPVTAPISGKENIVQFIWERAGKTVETMRKFGEGELVDPIWSIPQRRLALAQKDANTTQEVQETPAAKQKTTKRVQFGNNDTLIPIPGRKRSSPTAAAENQPEAVSLSKRRRVRLTELAGIASQSNTRKQ